MTRSGLFCIAVSLLAGLPAACDRRELSGPPTIRLGRDECAECGMLVSEDRCSCALLVEQDGRREHKVFDDLGCMLDYHANQAAAPNTTVIDTFVRDYATGGWIAAASARFVHADPGKIATPMGSGMIACESQASADVQRARSEGQVTDYQQLAELRRQWREGRRAKSPDGH